MKNNLRKLQFGSALTTVGPGSSHAKFQYKPLGFEKFAAPLQREQGYYDKAQAAVEDLDFQIKNLPYGTDPAKAKELAAQMTVKRDKIVNDLTKSKDYRNASRSIKKLQNNWTNNKHRQALESGALNWKALKQEQKERFTKNGKLDRDELAEWEARSIEEFEAKDKDGNLGGTNYKDDGLDGTWNTLGREVRLDNLTKEFRTESLKVAALVKSEKWDDLSRYQIDDDFIKNYKASHDVLKKEMIASKVESYMKSQPDFVKYFEEKADYSLYNLKKNPKEYNKVADRLIGTVTKQYTKDKEDLEKLEKKDKKLLTDEAHLKAKEHVDKTLDALQNENRRDGIVEILHQQEQMGQSFNADHLGRLLEHEYTKKFATYNAIPGAGSRNKDGENLIGTSTTPVDYNNYNLAGMGQQANDANKELRKKDSRINSYGNGIIRTITMGAKSSTTGGDGDYTLNGQDYRKEGVTWTKKVGNTYVALTKGNLPQRINTLNKNAVSKRTELSKSPTAIAARQLKLFQLHAQYGENDNVLRDELNKNGFNVSNDDVTKLQNLFNTQKGVLMDERATLETQYYATVEAEDRYAMLQTAAIGTKEFENISANAVIHLTPEETKAARAKGFNVNAGIVQTSTSPTTGASVSSGTESSSMLASDYAKLKGYKNVEEAYLKGDASTKARFAQDVFRIGADETIGKKIMSHRVIGNKDINVSLKNYFNGVKDLEGYLPAFGSDWRGAPGFDDEGNLKQDTEFDFSNGQGFRLVKHGKNMVIEAVISTDEGPKQIYMRPKKGFSSKLDIMLDHITDNLGNTVADDETRAFANGWKFDNRISNNVDEISFNAGKLSFPKYGDKQFDKLVKVKGINDKTKKVVTIARGRSLGSFVADPINAPAARTEFIQIKLDGANVYKVALRTNGEFRKENGNIKYFNTVNDAKGYIGELIYP